MTRLRRTRLFLAAHPFIVAVIVMALIYSVGAWRNTRFQDCLKDWATDFTVRTQQLSGPGNQRVDLFFQAYTEAAGSIEKPLTPSGKESLIAGLDKDRHTYTVIPSHADLVKQPDTGLLALRDLIRALRANDTYQQRAAAHPVPGVPTCGGIF